MTPQNDSTRGFQRRMYRDDSVSTQGSTGDANIRSSSDFSDEEHTAPVSLRFLERLPKPIRQGVTKISRWIQGPEPPRIWKINPWFPSIQTAPTRILDRCFPKRRHKIWLLIVFYCVWFAVFVSVLHRSAFASDVPGYGPPVRVGCTTRFWADGVACGVDGDRCRPFANSTMAFRCPANCERVQLLNPHAVGDQEVSYRQLVVGGPTDEQGSLSSAVYRSDSFICGSGIHSGFINNRAGGCGALRLVGEQKSFTSSKRNGITSIGFNSYFPSSFAFVDGTQSQCQDLRWPLLAVSLTFTILLSLFTTSPAVFFPSIFVGVFFHTALVSDPPDLTDYYSIFSITLSRFLPACFCMFVMYKYCVKRQQEGLTAQFEKTILWVGGCWIGALNNYTFDKIPIERLTPHDIKNQPGAVPALIIIVTILLCIAIGQAWAIRIEGRLPRYIVLYSIFVAVLLSLIAVPKMNLRIHHYILALLLLPGTALQNRPSLLYQGILVGLFINGTARWGFDSILQTPGELRGDGQLGTLLPIITAPVIHNNFGTSLLPNITFEWTLPLPTGFDGLAVLVNDVERFVGYEDQHRRSFTWVREHENEPEYFRFGYMAGSQSGDFTKAGKWDTDGSWTPMKSGPS